MQRKSGLTGRATASCNGSEWPEWAVRDGDTKGGKPIKRSSVTPTKFRRKPDVIKATIKKKPAIKRKPAARKPLPASPAVPEEDAPF